MVPHSGQSPHTPQGAQPATAPPGLRVGEYELLTRLGEGGMGVVHLARRPDGHRVALKVLRPHIVGDEEARQRLAREVSSLTRVRSRWVAEIEDSDPWGEIPYVATRYVPGPSLHDQVREHGPLLEQDLPWFAGRLADALSAVHAVGVLHRDIKPSNVLLEGRAPILIDFGLARVADDPRLTHTGWLLGTPGYLAPEILYGEDATTAADVHSWAATVAFAAVGKAPFGRGPAMAIMDRVRRGEHEDLDRLPRSIHAVVHDALDPDPRGRPTLPEILDRLGGSPTLEREAVPAGPKQPTMTLPIALASDAHAPTVVQPEDVALAADAVTDVLETDPPTLVEERPTRRYTEVLPADQAHTRAAPAVAVPAPMHAPLQAPPPPVHQPVQHHPVQHQQPQPQHFQGQPLQHQPLQQQRPGLPGPQGQPPYPGDQQFPPPKPTFAVRVRRMTLGLALLALAGALVGWMPYIALATLCVAAWLLRAGSITGSGHYDRRRRRGPRWYDAVVLPFAYPWGLLKAVPGTLLLLGWAGGLGVATALVCFAADAPLAPSLAAIGATVALATWWGPGGTRFRGPVQVLTHPVAANPWTWLVATAGVLVVAAAVGWLVLTQGVNWTPAYSAPLDEGSLLRRLFAR